MSSAAFIAARLGVWVLVLYVSIIIHEAGHAVAALAMRVQVRAVEVGTWKRLATFHAGGAAVTFRLLPIRGFTSTTTVPRSRARYVVFALGGLIVNILSIAVGCLLIGRLGFVAVIFALVNGLAFVENSLPLAARPPFRQRPSDGWVVLTLTRRPDELLKARPKAPPVTALVDELKNWKPPSAE
ncbi:MAG TPA: site-2 protease family protein [Acidimicrobiales bacterium]